VLEFINNSCLSVTVTLWFHDFAYEWQLDSQGNQIVVTDINSERAGSSLEIAAGGMFNCNAGGSTIQVGDGVKAGGYQGEEVSCRFGAGSAEIGRTLYGADGPDSYWAPAP
jgi:hypothetical protein